jgi:hypothetical protein
MNLFAIELETLGKRPLHSAELTERLPPGAVASHLELPFPRDGDFDFIALFETKSFHDRRG